MWNEGWLLTGFVGYLIGKALERLIGGPERFFPWSRKGTWVWMYTDPPWYQSFRFHRKNRSDST